MKKSIESLNKTAKIIDTGFASISHIRKKAQKNFNNEYQHIFIEKEWFLGEFKRQILENPFKKSYSVTKRYETPWTKEDIEILELIEQHLYEDYEFNISLTHSYGNTWDDEDPYDYLTVTITYPEDIETK